MDVACIRCILQACPIHIALDGLQLLFEAVPTFMSNPIPRGFQSTLNVNSLPIQCSQVWRLLNLEVKTSNVSADDFAHTCES